LHAFLVRRHLPPYSDVRSGLFVALAGWAAKKRRDLTASRERTWKANLLVPVQISAQARELYPLVRCIAAPRGFVRIVGLTGKQN
ncbi:MAG: Na-K-Cl cotransporter, partial [Spirochaetota bacterium]